MAIQIHRATDEATRERIYRFRYAVHVVELGKGGAGVDHERRMIVDDADASAVLFYAEDGDRIVGTVRGNWGALAPIPASYRELLDTGPAEEAVGRERVSVCSRLMVDPAYRGRTLASLLVLGQYDFGLSMGATVNFMLCELPLLRLYYRLGYRTYRSAIRPQEGMRVPLALCLHDREHILRVGSPFRARLPADVDDGGRTAALLAEAYPGFRTEAPRLEGDLRTLWASLAEGLTRKAGRRTLFDGLTPEEADRVFKASAGLEFRRGEVIRRRDERAPGLGVVLRGRLGLGLPTHDGWHWVELVQAGEVFGEPDAVDAQSRATDLVALEDATIAILRPNLIERLSRGHPELAIRLSRNLVTILHQRVDDLHRRSAAWAERDRDRLVREHTIPPIQETPDVGSKPLH